MTTIVIIFLIILFLFVLLILTNVSITIDFAHLQDDDHFQLKIKALYGLIRYKYEVPFIKIDKEDFGIVYEERSEGVQNSQQVKKWTWPDIRQRIAEIKRLMRNIVNVSVIIKKFLKTVKVQHLEWHSKVGVKEADNTAKLIGMIWSAKGLTIGMLSHYMKLMIRPDVSLIPSFQQPVSQTRFLCMFEVRAGNAILAGFKILKYWKGFRLASIGETKRDEKIGRNQHV